ncbi:MAG TPA: hypothetical protein PLM32_12980, partial [Candidatus Competibacter sp.]|nr:hypothetical protein [Candidatus Competibacter sp.]
MADNERDTSQDEPTEILEPDLRDRRDFLIGLGKWSKAVIGGVVLGGTLLPEHEAMSQPRPPLPGGGGPGPVLPLPPARR